MKCGKVLLIFLLLNLRSAAGGESDLLPLADLLNPELQAHPAPKHLQRNMDRPFLHPGLLVTHEKISFVRARIQAGDEPWASRWKALLQSDWIHPRHKPRARSHVIRDPKGKTWIGEQDLGRDAIRAYSLALAWALGEEEDHARRSVEFIQAWSESLESITGHDARLLAGITGHKFCNAAELLKHTAAPWPAERQRQFADMLRRVYVPLCENFFPKANGNWDASMILTLMSVGIYLDDRDLFDRAVQYAAFGKGNGSIPNYIHPNGVCQESARDQQHTQLGIGYLADACETAWSQGVDLYSIFDRRLAIGLEFTAGYNLGEDAPEGTRVSPEGRGRLRPIYARPLAHYQGRLEREMPQTTEAARRVPHDTVHWDHLPWQELTSIPNTD